MSLAVACAVANQGTPDGWYKLDRSTPDRPRASSRFRTSVIPAVARQAADAIASSVRLRSRVLARRQERGSAGIAEIAAEMRALLTLTVTPCCR
jgi:hypothetical protein